MKLSGKTNIELIALTQAIEADPANQISNSIWKYTPQARRKLDAIARAITRNLRDVKIARGEYINTDGYSGRQSNRR